MEATSLLAKVSNGQKDHIDLGDVMCPICLSVLIKPVKMPCDHILCMPCFEANVGLSSLNCPICRKRISIWCRKAKKEGNLVWDDLWQIIKEKFPARVEARLAGVDDVDADDIVPCLPMHQFVDTGAIKSEFDESLLKEKEEMLRKQTEEEKKSLELIKKLEQEEREERERELERKRQQEEIDMDMARKIMESPDESPRKNIGSNQTGVVRGKENKAATVRGPLDAYFGSPEISKKKSSLSNSSALSHFTRPQKYEHKLFKPNVPNVERCPSTESIQSNNSIDAELNHFKPIRSAPLSPPKRLPDGSVLETQVVKTQPRNLSNEFSSSPGPSRTSTSSRRRGAESIVKEPEVPDTPRPESISSHGEPESLFCNETLRLTLTPTPSPGLKTRSLVDPSGGSQASPVFKTSMDMDTQHLGQIMGQGYESLDPSIIEEQRRMEEQIKQQIDDEKFAKLLQDDLDRQERSVNRKKGSPDEYNLRDSAKKLPPKPRLPLSPRTPKNASLTCKSKLAMTPKTPKTTGGKSKLLSSRKASLSAMKRLREEESSNDDEENASLTCKSKLAMTPKTTGVKYKLLSSRKASLSAMKRLREEESSSDDEASSSQNTKKSRRMSIVEATKKKSVETSGNDSEEF